MSDRVSQKERKLKKRSSEEEREDGYDSKPEGDVSSLEEHSSKPPSKKKKSRSKDEKSSAKSRSEKKSKHRHKEAHGETEDFQKRDLHGSDASEAEETIGDEEDIERRETSKKKSSGELEATLQLLIEKMEIAYETDKKDLENRKPALSKLKMLHELDMATLQESSRNELLQKDIFSILAKWLRPYADNTLPNLTIRSSLIDIIGRFQLDIDELEEHVKPSQLGRVLTKLQCAPQETAENKRKIEAITDKWKRTLNPSSSTFGKKEKGGDRRLSAQRGPQKFSEICRDIDEKRKQPLKPGDAGFRMGIRVPVAIDLRNIRPPKSVGVNDESLTS